MSWNNIIPWEALERAPRLMTCKRCEASMFSIKWAELCLKCEADERERIRSG